MMQNTRSRAHCGGFTLIEIVVSMVLLGILAVVGANMLSDTFRTSNVVVRDTIGIGAARYTMERLGREIREAKTVLSNSSTALSFVKNNGLTVSISNSGATVLLGAGTASQTLADNVSVFGMAYRDADLAITTSPGAIRFVDISLTVLPVDSPDTSPAAGPGVSLTTRIAMRAPA